MRDKNVSYNLLQSSLTLPTGTPALTTRGMKEADMDQVAGFIHEGIQIAVDANNTLAAQASSKGKAATNAKVSLLCRDGSTSFLMVCACMLH